MIEFPPSRDAALKRLQDFLPKAGRAYAARRNYDRAGDVSGLSPFIRHRVITETEVLRATRAAHTFKAAEKFIAEVYWRTYWKGWLERRPEAWTSYKAGLQAALNRVQSESGLRAEWEAACTGQTGIDCFDHWAKELAETGYLHNHARMWFASIWIFTLRLPWELGADFFLRHLLDGDPASNTLSWRWVGGLQTLGKTYLARPDNIYEFTDGRFRPVGLATHAAPLPGQPHPPPGPVPVSDPVPSGRLGLLVTEDDLTPDLPFAPVAAAIVQTTPARSPLHVADRVTGFVDALMDDAATRLNAERIAPEALKDWISDHRIDALVTPYIPVGPTRDALADLPLRQIVRPQDSGAWEHATKGFFAFKQTIPALLAQI